MTSWSTRQERDARERFNLAVDWSKRNLPLEHPQLAASACLTLRLMGKWPTPQEVQARLALQGLAA